MIRLTLMTGFWLLMFWASTAIGIERPGAVEPQLDQDDNPTYYMTYGKGDRINPSTNKPLNLIQTQILLLLQLQITIHLLELNLFKKNTLEVKRQ